MEAAIISVLGAGLLGLFGVFMQLMRSDMRSLGQRLDARFDALEKSLRGEISEAREDLGRLEKSLRGEISEAREDLGRLEKSLRGEISEVREDLGRLEKSLRGEISEVREDLGRLEKSLRGELGEVKERLAAIEATQAEHGRLLEHMMDHGERLAALEGAARFG